jgi:hypothetical protein
MEVATTAKDSRSAGRVPASVTVVQAVCAFVAIVCIPGVLLYGAGTALWVFGWLISKDPEFRSYPHWLDYEGALVFVALVAIVVTLSLAALGLTGSHAHRAWTAGLIGVALILLSGIALSLAPLLSAVQGWMPELLLGLSLLALGGLLGLTMTLPSMRRWVAKPGQTIGPRLG